MQQSTKYFAYNNRIISIWVTEPKVAKASTALVSSLIFAINFAIGKLVLYSYDRRSPKVAFTKLSK